MASAAETVLERARAKVQTDKAAGAYFDPRTIREWFDVWLWRTRTRDGFDFVVELGLVLEAARNAEPSSAEVGHSP